MDRASSISAFIADNTKDVKSAYCSTNNVSRISNQKFNEALDSMSAEEREALAIEAGWTEDYEPSATVETPTVEGIEMLSNTTTRKDGTKATAQYHNLEVIGRSNGKRRHWHLKYGTSFVSVRPTANLVKLNQLKPIQVGDVLPIKAGVNEDGEPNLVWNPDFNCFEGTVLVSAHEDLMKIAEQRQGGNNKHEQVMLLMTDYDLSYEDAEKMYMDKVAEEASASIKIGRTFKL